MQCLFVNTIFLAGITKIRDIKIMLTSHFQKEKNLLDYLPQFFFINYLKFNSEKFGCYIIYVLFYVGKSPQTRGSRPI